MGCRRSEMALRCSIVALLLRVSSSRYWRLTSPRRDEAIVSDFLHVSATYSDTSEGDGEFMDAPEGAPPDAMICISFNGDGTESTWECFNHWGNIGDEATGTFALASRSRSRVS